MKKGDIVFIKGSSIVSKIITKLDKNGNGEDGKFSHVAIAISDKHMVEAEYTSKVSVVNFENLTKKGKIKRFKAVDLKLTAEEREKLYQSSMTYIGRKYDYLQIVGIVISKLFGIKLSNDRDRFICSELVVNAMKDSGLLNGYDYDKLVSMTPNQLYEFIDSQISE